MSEFNKKVIEEFRANGGKVGGFFENMTLLLLHTVGAKSGEHRLNPTAYIKEGEELIIAASKAGADSHPDWYFNLIANPEVRVEVGDEEFSAVAESAQEPERTHLYDKLKKKYPGFVEYEQKTKRVIPIIKLSRL
jgi:deazaflavin-dependent oxidoreductase (nitroreductase family)